VRVNFSGSTSKPGAPWPIPAASDPVFGLFATILLQATAAATVAIWMLVWRQPLDGPHFVLILLMFLAAGEACPALSPNFRSALSLRELSAIWLRWILISAMLWAGMRLARMFDHVDWRVFAGAAASIPFALWIARSLVLSTFLRRLSAPAQQQRIAVVGLTDIGVHWASRLSGDRWNDSTVTFFDDRHADRLPAEYSGTLAGSMARLPDFVRANKVQSVYITLPISRHQRIVQIIEGLRDCTASIYFVPDLLNFDLVQARMECVHGVPLLAIRASPFVGMAALTKRTTDLVVSGLALAALAIPMLMIAATIRLTSKGPALFKQRRYGLDGEEIPVLKFRTMAVMEDGAAQYVQVTRKDPRVTRFGAFLRATSLDELPQLINVFMGSMSIVGPRPHAIAVNERYRALIPNYMVRHKVKPGITGLAQINGCRGGDDLESMTRRIEYDLAYLRNWSIGLDFSIIFRTAATVWRDRNAY
jgi:putative colanic acid biosynthesis UDP-glucose lipid carrier transferase